MLAELLLLPVLLLLVLLIAVPALVAVRRRRLSRELSEVAAGLERFAKNRHRGTESAPLDEQLHTRAARLQIPEYPALLLAQQLAKPGDSLLADTAQRLSLRLKRRVAFERKMLARTASGRRRGAVAASVPPMLLLVLLGSGVQLPVGALLFLALLEACGCWLLWRLARVEI